MAEQQELPEWKLIYWHNLPGRGDFVRLMFEEAGVPYDDVCRREGNSSTAVSYYKNQHEGFPVLYPPIVQNGDFVMCETSAIMNYLGKKYGLYPDGDSDEVRGHALQVVLSVQDYIGEGHDCFHPINKHGTYASQKEEAQPYIERFTKERLPRYLNYFEKVLKRNNDGKGFFIGDKITYVDIAVFHALRATESQFPDEYKSLPIPTLREFKNRMAERPRIKAFLQSDRCRSFDGNSMM